mmetsp:Transcript_17493/g.54236  ORF Transcript_17493/g.54236 Transcript_17493/m.54236 type:complete len:217 (-) Transcript_17493:2281-2931(-)
MHWPDSVGRLFKRRGALVRRCFRSRQRGDGAACSFIILRHGAENFGLSFRGLGRFERVHTAGCRRTLIVFGGGLINGEQRVAALEQQPVTLNQRTAQRRVRRRPQRLVPQPLRRELRRRQRRARLRTVQPRPLVPLGRHLLAHQVVQQLRRVPLRRSAPELDRRGLRVSASGGSRRRYMGDGRFCFLLAGRVAPRGRGRHSFGAPVLDGRAGEFET